MKFHLLSKPSDVSSHSLCRARVGELSLPHQVSGKSPHLFQTPLFMPVGTQASVKCMSPDDLVGLNAQIILGNTYHLYLRPGHKRIEALGGLHRFMDWERPILTDSGGFQVFSLAGLNQIDEQGVTFQSHIDGSRHHFTPELSMEVQKALGSQIVMAFDHCPPYPASEEEVRAAMRRTLSWARRGLEVSLKPHQSCFGIIQGGLYEDLRRQSAQEITALPFDGFAIGGLSIGESLEKMQQMAYFSASLLPENRPRYLMGVGRPEDLVEGVYAGIDLFDCVLPTRNARNGQLFTSRGKINIKNACHADSELAIDPECSCLVCQRFSRAYLRHLFVSREPLSARLNTLHNLTYYLQLMQQMRTAILNNTFESWKENFYYKRREQVKKGGIKKE